jgi:hypothetical protein
LLHCRGIGRLGFALFDYYKRFFRAFWTDFAKSTKEQLLSAVLALAILILQVRYGVSKPTEIKGNEWAIGWPYIVLVSVLFVFHLVRAPWKLNEEHEARHAEESQKRAQLEFEIAALNQKLLKALGDPGGPDIVLERAARDEIRVSNLQGGTAHGLVIHPMKCGRLVCGEHKIPYLGEGKHVDYSPVIESDLHKFSGPFKFDAFLTAAQRSKPPEQKTLEERIPISITYEDGGHKKYFCEYEMHYNFVTQEVRITRTSRKTDLLT